MGSNVLIVTVLPFFTFCSPFPFNPPQTSPNCQPHLSDQGNSSHLLSVRLAHDEDPCSSEVSGQIGLCVQEWADFCLPTLSESWDCPQPSVPNHGFCFYAPFSVSVWTFWGFLFFSALVSLSVLCWISPAGHFFCIPLCLLHRHYRLYLCKKKDLFFLLTWHIQYICHMTGCWTAKCLKCVSHNIQSAGQKGLYYCMKTIRCALKI